MQKQGQHDLHGIGQTLQRWMGSLCMPWALLLVLCVQSASAAEGNDIRSFAGGHPGGNKNSKETSGGSSAIDSVESTTTVHDTEGATVKRLWGAADTTATVGKFFQYHIPSDAFSGPVSRFEVSAAGGSDLPSWLHFKAGAAILEGVPTESDLGQHYITVEAIEETVSSGEHDHAKDVFSIDVMSANHKNSAAFHLKTLLSSDEVVRCEAGEGVTKMALAVDTDVQAMPTTDRIALLENLARYLQVGKEALQLLPRKKDNLLDASAILAGPGNVRLPSTPGSILQWQVGCGGKVDETHQSLLKQVEYSARNGSLAARLRHPIIGWHIAMHTSSLSRRVKRQPYMGYTMPVPAILPIISTRHAILPDTDTSTEIVRPPPYKPTGPNTKPTIRRRVDKLAIVAGKVFQYQIPDNTFHDREDGNTRNLRLFLLSYDGSALLAKSWVQFDSNTQTIYGLPLKDHIGRHSFVLEAMDEAEATVREQLDIAVHQHSLDRRINHEFVLMLEHDIYTFVNLVDRNVFLVEKLKNFYGEAKIKPLTSSTITVQQAGKDFFKWTNDTLVQRSFCPQKEIEEVYSKMVVSKNEVTDALVRTLQPEFRQLRVQLHYLGTCKNIATSIPTSVTSSSTKPIVRNQIDIIKATVGEFIHFTIPQDTFYDEGPGQSFNLKLELFASSNAKMRPSDWIRYDSTLNALVGLPMAHNVGTHKFHLVASNKDNKQATEVFAVEVYNRVSQRDSVEFSLSLDYDYNLFQGDLNNTILVIDKLVNLYGDSDTSNINVLHIGRGSVEFAWTNKSLPSAYCPEEQIIYLTKFLFNENGTVSQQLANTFLPEFNVTKARYKLLGRCFRSLTRTLGGINPVMTVQTEHATNDMCISTIILVVLIAAIVV